VPVQVAPVLKQAVAGWQAFSGRLEAVERVELRPRVAGTVQAVHFREGSLVRPGERLLSLDPAPYAADVARAEAQVAAAEARVAHTTSELARAQRLWDERAIAQRELDERANAAREALARLRAEQAGLQAARLSLSYTEVVAPVAGRIGKLEVTPGNLVAAGAAAPVLATLVSVHPIYAGFDADEKLVARALASLPEGAAARGAVERIPVEMELAGGGVVRGRLQLVDNQVDARSGTVRVRAVFDNRDGRLMPGQFARLRLGQAQAEEALLVSERAVGTDQDKRFVIVAAADNTAQWREVTLGAHVSGAGGALRIVTSGLKGDERIVVSGVQRVRPGALLAPTAVGMEAKPEQQAAKAAGARS
jgi:membrane fusion protein, multidrug efflux system